MTNTTPGTRVARTFDRAVGTVVEYDPTYRAGSLDRDDPQGYVLLRMDNERLHGGATGVWVPLSQVRPVDAVDSQVDENAPNVERVRNLSPLDRIRHNGRDMIVVSRPVALTDDRNEPTNILVVSVYDVAARFCYTIKIDAGTAFEIQTPDIMTYDEMERARRNGPMPAYGDTVMIKANRFPKFAGMRWVVTSTGYLADNTMPGGTRWYVTITRAEDMIERTPSRRRSRNAYVADLNVLPSRDMSMDRAIALVADDQRQSYPEMSDDEAIQHVRDTVHLGQVEGDDQVAQAYRYVLATG